MEFASQYYTNNINNRQTCNVFNTSNYKNISLKQFVSLFIGIHPLILR